MPKRTDIASILVIGSGPIVIGQGCEFDYSGTQAIKALREHGFRVVLVNSNPATIMTDPEFADATYIEPITAPFVEAVMRKERPDAVLPTLGGQTALNVTMELADRGVFEDLGIEIIGASLDAILTAEDRGRFKTAMDGAGIATAKASYVTSLDEALSAVESLGYPAMVRPSFILGGGGTGLARDEDDFRSIVTNGIATSPVGEVLIEESVEGWKEYELEVMRDATDNAVIVCSIENLDPMGVHTGDSITVAPAMTLSDREYQLMRNEAIECLRIIGVETGGSNVQFAVDPATGRRIIIEMNPRVSRSSALASKATGFPIAKMAALLAVGFTLDEIANDITLATPASFEPALDYVVVKVPRFDFAKFPSVEPTLGTAMQSVGEAMAIGRTFPEALQKALRSLESGRGGLNGDPAEISVRAFDRDELELAAARPSPTRLFEIAEWLRRGGSIEEVNNATGVDPWFLDQIAQINDMRASLEQVGPDPDLLLSAKRMGFSNPQFAFLWNWSIDQVREFGEASGINVTFKTVDTCAAEFEASTPYFYSTYEDDSEATTPDRKTVIVLGSGPNRIGQGIEFDYCCVHAAFALDDAGYDSVMVNCNPETVSTDYDTSTRLYFEPLTIDDVLAIVEVEQPHAVVVQLGGQTPLGLAKELEAAGVPIAGTTPAAIDRAEDREQFSALCAEWGLRQPPHGTATSVAEAQEVVDAIGLPALIRPSYVLGGRAMRIIYSIEDLASYLTELYGAVPGGEVDLSDAPLLIDRFLESAIEVDVDAVFDGTELYIGGIMEHVEEAGVHSGDSACVVPPPTLGDGVLAQVREDTLKLAKGLDVRGLLNIQFAVRGDDVFVLEANPRASRTVPFISKATGVQLAKVATRVMLGESLAELRAIGVVPRDTPTLSYTAVKEAVLPWKRFPDEDTLLGPEMRATGEVMGVGPTAGIAYAKALRGAGHTIPDDGAVFISLADRDKTVGVEIARILTSLGFRLYATHGTAGHLARHSIRTTHVDKVGEGAYDPVQLIEDDEIGLVVNTPAGGKARGDGRLIRLAANRHAVPSVTTAEGGLAVARAIQAARSSDLGVESIQNLHRTGVGLATESAP